MRQCAGASAVVPHSPDWHTVLTVIESVTRIDDLDAFGPCALEALEPIVPFDIASLNEIDPDSGRVRFCSRPAHLVEERPEEIEVFPGLIHQNPILQHQQHTGDGSARRLSDFLTPGQLHDLELYQRVYGPLGIEYQVAVGLPTKSPLVVAFALNRGDHDFSDAELELLNLLRPHLIQAYRNLRALAAVNDTMGAAGRAVIVLGASEDDATMTPWAAERIEEHFGPARTAGGLPDPVLRWVASERQRVLDGGEPRLHQPLVSSMPQGQLVARFIAGSGHRADVVVIDDRTTERRSSELRRLGLTPREAEVLWLLMRGEPTTDIAKRVDASPATVNKHLQNIYRKLGVTNRTAAVATAQDAVFTVN